MENVLAFLNELSNNNDRDWFQANKKWYDQAKNEFEHLVDNIIKGIREFDPEIGLLTAKDCTFRIYRDVRFSKNKAPYKTNMGAAISKGGRKSRYASYYLHIEPGNCFVGGGKWMPPSNELKSIRYEIFNFTGEFLNIIESDQFKKDFGDIDGDKLTRPPKEFPVDFEYIELLKFKSYTAGRSIPEEVVQTGHLLPESLYYFRQLHPFIAFLNRALENV